MKKTTYCLLAMLWPLLNLFANPTKSIQPLTVGDKMPDITFSNLINHGGNPKMKLSSLKGKLVILDFWSTRCGTCISLFPHMNQLQKRFGDSVQIILVNTKSKMMGDDRPKIERLFAKLKEHIGLNNKLPVVYGLDTLDALFPCRLIPHEIWIDGTGKVIAITSAHEVTEANISSAINGAKMNLRIKKDVMAGEEMELADLAKSNETSILYSSIFTRYQNGYGSQQHMKTIDGKLFKGMKIYNTPLLTFCSMAANDTVFVQKEQLILDVTKREMFEINNGDSSLYQNRYCYDLTVPPSTMAQMKRYMLEDLKKALNITIKKEKRMMDCYELVANAKITQSISKGGKQDLDLEPPTLKKFITNEPISQIIWVLCYHKLFDRPLVAGPGLGANYDLLLPFDLSDHQSLVKSLSDAGFEIREVKKEMEVTVITDK